MTNIMYLLIHLQLVRRMFFFILKKSEVGMYVCSTLMIHENGEILIANVNFAREIILMKLFYSYNQLTEVPFVEFPSPKKFE